MDKQNVLYPYNGTLFGNKNKLDAETCYNTDEPWKHAMWKEPDTKDHILYASTFIKYPE